MYQSFRAYVSGCLKCRGVEFRDWGWGSGLRISGFMALECRHCSRPPKPEQWRFVPCLGGGGAYVFRQSLPQTRKPTLSLIVLPTIPYRDPVWSNERFWAPLKYNCCNKEPQGLVIV